MTGLLGRLGLREPLMQLRPNVVWRIGISLALIACDQRTARDDAGDTRQPDPLPDASHRPSLPKLPW